jgi:hypothetical protein
LAESGPAEDFLARSAGLPARYQARLEQVALISDPGEREFLGRLAGRVVLECAQVLGGGPGRPEASPAGGEPGPWPRTGPARGCAAGILFDLVFETLEEVLREYPDSGLLRPAVVSLRRAVWTGLDADNDAGPTAGAGIAREVHDRVGNGISLAMRRLEVWSGAYPEVDDRAAAQIAGIRDGLAGTLGELGLILRGTRSRQVRNSLQADLTAFVAAVQRPEPAVTIRVTGDERRAPAALLDELFLVVRECLRNTFAHARARHVAVVVTIGPEAITGSVDDDGIGFDRPRADASGGLASMAGRIASVSGRLEVRSGPSPGTRVRLWIPIPER